MKANRLKVLKIVLVVTSLITCQQILTACGGDKGQSEHQDLAKPSDKQDAVSAESSLKRGQQQNAFLFKVEKDGKTSYILGSMHAGIPLKTYPDFIFSLAAQAKEFAFEADREAFLEKHKVEIKAATLYPAGETLDQHLSTKGIEKLKSIYGEESYEKLRPYRPWAVEQNISESAKNKLKKNSSQDLWDVNKGIDMTLLKKAKERQVDITYVDNLEKKIETFDKNFTAEDLEILLAKPNPVEFLVDCATMAQTYYLAGNRDAFKDYNQKCETKPFLAELEARTISWVPKLEPLFQRGDAFVVVGADHMNGPNGLESLLKARGYSIIRVTASQ